MASLGFANRFKNKIEKIGKEGYMGMESFKAIEKEEIPRSKMHAPFLRLLPVPQKLMISSNFSNSQNKSIENYKIEDSRSKTPYKMLPNLGISPGRSIENCSARSKSPLDYSYKSLNQHNTTIESSKSFAKLPRINSGLKNIRINMKKKINFLVSKPSLKEFITDN